MELDYEYGFSVELAADLPTDVVGFLQALAAGEPLGDVPTSGADASEVADDQVFRLLAGRSAGGLAERVDFEALESGNGWRLRVWGQASSESFFMPYPALAEWLAERAEADGWAGFYHRRSLQHPTMVYFAQGRPYMLQVTGTPLGMVDGAPYPPTGAEGDQSGGSGLPEDEEDWGE